MPDGREFELKFAIDARDADRLFRHPALVPTIQRRHASRLMSTYFDTPDSWLHRHRVSLRVRQSDCGNVQTVKRAKAASVDRKEWEHQSGDTPDIDWLKTIPLWPLLKKGDIAGRLEPAFWVDVQRISLPIAFKGAAIEGAFDRGAIRAKGLSLPVSEFELELQSGPSDAVFALGRRLARDLPLVPSLATKSERGHAVADLTWGQPTTALDLDLGGIRAMAPAFAAIVQACLHTLLKNTALITGEDDVGAVHKARVALRRLRAAITLFRPVLRAKRLRCLRRDLEWAWTTFSAARDADVAQAGIEAGGVLAEQGGGPLVEIMAATRRRANARVRKVLASSRWRLFCLDLILFSMNGVKRHRRRTAYGPFARRRLARQHRALARRAKGIARQSSHALHAVRKDAKTLRYDIEIFADVPKLGAARAARRLHADLEIIQVVLGGVQDKQALGARLRAIIEMRVPPAGVAPEAWAVATFAAGELVADLAQDKTGVSRAKRAARSIRRSNAFA